MFNLREVIYPNACSRIDTVNKESHERHGMDRHRLHDAIRYLVDAIARA